MLLVLSIVSVRSWRKIMSSRKQKPPSHEGPQSSALGIPPFACVVAVTHEFRRPDALCEPHFRVVIECPDGVKVVNVSPATLMSRRKFAAVIVGATKWPLSPPIGKQCWETCVVDMLLRGRLRQNSSRNAGRPQAS